MYISIKGLILKQNVKYLRFIEVTLFLKSQLHFFFIIKTNN